MALYEVKIYNGKGVLKEIIQPVMDYTDADMVKYPPHKCLLKTCKNITTKRGCCGPVCSKEQKRLKALAHKAKLRSN